MDIVTSASDHVIAIHGAPRSGTSWLGQLFNSSEHVAYRYQPFFSYAFRGRVDTHTDEPGLRRFFADLLASQDEFVLQTGDKRLSVNSPQFTKRDVTHLVYKEVRFHHLLPHLLATLPGLKAIGIVRDPRAVLASWSRAPREFDPAWSLATEWRLAPAKNAGLEENWYGFERWKQLTELLLELAQDCPTRFRLVRYEDLVAAPQNEVAELFQFCGLTYAEQTARFIGESTSRDDGDSYGVFRRHGNPESILSLPTGIAEQIKQDLAGTPLTRFLASISD